MQCYTLSQKIRLVIGILEHFGAHDGQRRFNSRFDVNNDGVINFDDLLQVLFAPNCPRR